MSDVSRPIGVVKRKRRAMGQHYLVDDSVVRLILEASAIKRDERVLEIGTGRGTLTTELCKLSNRVEAYELDRENFRIIKALGMTGLTLHNEDAFSAAPIFDVLVSSLP